MSGGKWNYEQERLQHFGERLEQESMPALQAIGLHLQELAVVLNDADRLLSCDSSKWDEARALALVPKDTILRTTMAKIRDMERELVKMREFVTAVTVKSEAT